MTHNQICHHFKDIKAKLIHESIQHKLLEISSGLKLTATCKEWLIMKPLSIRAIQKNK